MYDFIIWFFSDFCSFTCILNRLCICYTSPTLVKNEHLVWLTEFFFTVFIGVAGQKELKL